jgi:hypothetical protein
MAAPPWTSSVSMDALDAPPWMALSSRDVDENSGASVSLFRSAGFFSSLPTKFPFSLVGSRKHLGVSLRGMAGAHWRICVPAFDACIAPPQHTSSSICTEPLLHSSLPPPTVSWSPPPSRLNQAMSPCRAGPSPLPKTDTPLLVPPCNHPKGYTSTFKNCIASAPSKKRSWASSFTLYMLFPFFQILSEKYYYLIL